MKLTKHYLNSIKRRAELQDSFGPLCVSELVEAIEVLTESLEGYADFGGLEAKEALAKVYEDTAYGVVDAE